MVNSLRRTRRIILLICEIGYNQSELSIRKLQSAAELLNFIPAFQATNPYKNGPINEARGKKRAGMLRDIPALSHEENYLQYVWIKLAVNGITRRNTSINSPNMKSEPNLRLLIKA